MEIRENVKLAVYTTFGIGGNAKFFAVASRIKDIAEGIKLAKEKNVPILILGGGSNVLISDSGFDGLVIKNEIKGLEIHGREVTVTGGENWDAVVAKCIEAGLQGIECLSGIPGTAGGGLVQNIGAYGQTLARVVVSVEFIDLETGETKTLQGDECEFEYRNSIFKKSPGKYLVTKFTMNLNYGQMPELSYPSVARLFVGQKPTLQEVRDGVIQIRASKGMVIMPEFESLRSVGSYFKNPIVTKKQMESIKHMITCPDPWHWPDGSNVKLSAACLITQAGFSKGQKIGKAEISHLQPLALVNPGDALSSDIKFAASHIKQRIMEKFNINLEEEVVFVGNFD